jgi:hypothetical protein
LGEGISVFTILHFSTGFVGQNKYLSTVQCDFAFSIVEEAKQFMFLFIPNSATTFRTTPQQTGPPLKKAGVISQFRGSDAINSSGFVISFAALDR